MTNIVNLNIEREKRNTRDDSTTDLIQTAGMCNASVELMKNIISSLRDNNINPSDPETAENMIFISMLFQSHIDNINEKENSLYKFFDMMREEVMADE